LDFDGELMGAVNIGKTMMKYPGLVYLCKGCREADNESLSNNVKNICQQVEEIKSEIIQLKSTGASWSSMAKQFKEKTSKNVLIIDSKNGVKFEDLKKDMKNKLKDEEIDIINTLPTRNKDGLIVVCGNEEEKVKLQKAVTKKMVDIMVGDPIKKSPRIKILNVELEDDEKESYLIVDQILRRNKSLDILSVFQKFDHVATIPIKYKRKIVANKYNIIFSVDSSTYKKIMELKRIKIGYQQCKVVDGAHVTRCFKCFGFFHKANDCPKKDEKKCMRCCGNNHKMDECKFEQKCNNCAEFNKKNKKNVDENHSIFDKKCPCYQKSLK
jgi:hypothetical protein